MYSEMPCCSTSCNGKSSLLVVMSMTLEAVLIVWDKVASLAYFFLESSIKLFKIRRFYS